MKVPSFIRLPKHQRFTFKARHYDPVKEEIEQRVSKIKTTMEADHRHESADLPPSTIAGSFRAKSKVGSVKPSASGLQLIIALFLMVTIFGWLYYGNTIFYSYFLALPVVVWYRSRHILASISSLFSVIAFMGIYIFGWQFPYLQQFMVLTMVIAMYFWIKSRLVNKD